ncbi:membrane-targeted effector domain-containing toxin [Vibrio splendidus]
MRLSVIFTVLIFLIVTMLHAAPCQNVRKSADFLEKVALKPMGCSYLGIISKLKAVHDINGDEESKAESLIELYKLVNKYITEHPESKITPGIMQKRAQSNGL